MWLRYLYENEAFTRSGRWYRALITAEQAQQVTATTSPWSTRWHCIGIALLGKIGGKAMRSRASQLALRVAAPAVQHYVADWQGHEDHRAPNAPTAYE